MFTLPTIGIYSDTVFIKSAIIVGGLIVFTGWIKAFSKGLSHSYEGFCSLQIRPSDFTAGNCWYGSTKLNSSVCHFFFTVDVKVLIPTLPPSSLIPVLYSPPLRLIQVTWMIRVETTCIYTGKWSCIIMQTKSQ